MFLNWEDLNDAEKEQATETYIYLREQEEQRERNDVVSNTDYSAPIDPGNAECCCFERDENGYISVII